jgi:hypothetical protein
MNDKNADLAPEAMIQRFCSEGGEWYTFDTSAPEAIGLVEGSIIDEAERYGSDKGEWCTIHQSMKCIVK